MPPERSMQLVRHALNERIQRLVTRSDMLRMDIEDEGLAEDQRWLPVLESFGRLLCTVGELVRVAGMEEQRE